MLGWCFLTSYTGLLLHLRLASCCWVPLCIHWVRLWDWWLWHWALRFGRLGRHWRLLVRRLVLLGCELWHWLRLSQLYTNSTNWSGQPPLQLDEYLSPSAPHWPNPISQSLLGMLPTAHYCHEENPRAQHSRRLM